MRRDYKYNIVRRKGEPTSVTIFYKGDDYVATSAHPNFDIIIKAIERGDKAKKIVGLFDAYQSIGDRFRAAAKKAVNALAGAELVRQEKINRISKKVTVKDKKVYYEGKEVHGALADTIATFMTEGNEDFGPLALFLEKVMTNPNEHSREQLFTWLRHLSFHITDDGDFLAYKYVRDDYTSDSSGVGIVNGKRVNGHLDNSIGNTIEMPRKMVTHDPTKTCAAGLHVGTKAFVWSQHKRLLMVKVNPRDVVSVPTDANGQKLRVCRYEVMADARKTSFDKVYAGSTVSV